MPTIVRIVVTRIAWRPNFVRAVVSVQEASNELAPVASQSRSARLLIHVPGQMSQSGAATDVRNRVIRRQHALPLAPAPLSVSAIQASAVTALGCVFSLPRVLKLVLRTRS